MTAVVVVGAGGFGRETLDVAEAVDSAVGPPAAPVIGVVDDAPSPVNLQRLAARGVPYLGTVQDWLGRGDGANFVVAVGDPRVRGALARRLQNAGRRPVSLVHPQAVLGSRVTLGPGAVVCAGAIVSTNVTLGAHVHVNPGAVLGHDTVLGDCVSVNPRAVVSGECRVEAGALLGAGSVVLQGLMVGAGAVVGAAACVVRDVPPAAVVKGVPAR